MPEFNTGIPIVFDHLVKMKLYLQYFDGRFTEFLLRHKTLEVLEIEGFWYLEDTIFTRLLTTAENLPNLFELNMGCVDDVEDKALTILMNGKINLKKINFTTKNSEKIERFRTLLNSTWEVESNQPHKDKLNFTFTRKEIDS